MTKTLDYQDFVEAQTGLSRSSIRVMQSTVSNFPPIERLNARWFRKRIRQVAPATVRRELKLAKQVLDFYELDTSVFDKLKTPKIKDSVTVEDLYKREELAAIFRACHETRDRALIQVLYESAVRAGELVSMTVKNLEFSNDDTATIIVTGKTGTRQIPILASVPALKAWLNVHPTGTGRLWVTLRSPHEPIGYMGVYLLVKRILRDAKLERPTKKIVHMFRHTRITELVTLGIRGQTLLKLVGWTKGSNMEAVYVHLTTEDVHNEVRAKVFGMGSEKERTPLLSSMVCPKCETKNEQEARICINCNMPLSNDAIVQAIKYQEQEEERSKKRTEEMEELKREMAEIKALLAKKELSP